MGLLARRHTLQPPKPTKQPQNDIPHRQGLTQESRWSALWGHVPDAGPPPPGPARPAQSHVGRPAARSYGRTQPGPRGSQPWTIKAARSRVPQRGRTRTAGLSSIQQLASGDRLRRRPLGCSSRPRRTTASKAR
jgi:hypothetical protein